MIDSFLSIMSIRCKEPLELLVVGGHLLRCKDCMNAFTREANLMYKFLALSPPTWVQSGILRFIAKKILTFSCFICRINCDCEKITYVCYYINVNINILYFSPNLHRLCKPNYHGL